MNKVISDSDEMFEKIKQNDAIESNWSVCGELNSGRAH